MIEPLVQDENVELFWQPRKTIGCKLCGCDIEEQLRWIGDEFINSDASSR